MSRLTTEKQFDGGKMVLAEQDKGVLFRAFFWDTSTGHAFTRPKARKMKWTRRRVGTGVFISGYPIGE